MRVFQGGAEAAARARQVALHGRIAIWLTTDRDGVEIGLLYGPEAKLLEIGRLIFSRTSRTTVIAQVGTEHQHITVYQPELRNAIRLCRFGDIADTERARSR